MDKKVAVLQKALLLSVLAFQEHYTNERQEEQDKLDKMSDTEREEYLEQEGEEFPEELSEEDFVEKYTNWLSDETLEAFFDAKLEPSDEKRLDLMLKDSRK